MEPEVPELDRETQADRGEDRDVVTRRRPGLPLSRSLGWLAASYGAAILGYLAVNAVSGRLLGPSSFGYFVIVLTATGIISQIGLLGVHRAGLREVARLPLDDHEGLSTVRGGVRAVCLLTLPAAAAFSGVATWFLVEGSIGARLALSGGIALLVFLGGQQALWANYLRGFGQIRLASLLGGRSGGAAIALLQAIFLVLVWRLTPGWGLAGAVAAVCTGYVLPVVLAWTRVSRRWKHLPPRRNLRTDLGRVLRRDSRFAVMQVAGFVNSSVELWLAGWVLSAADTSMFSAAQRLSILLTVPFTMIQIAFAPAISRLWAAGDPRRLERLLRTGASITGAAALVGWLPMLIVPALLLQLVYGPGFAGGAVLLMLLSCGTLANVLSGLCGSTLSMSHNEGIAAGIQWAAVAVRVPLGIAAVTLFGPIGLAASASTCTAGMYAAMWLAARRRVGVNTLPTLRPSPSLLRRVTA